MSNKPENTQNAGQTKTLGQRYDGQHDLKTPKSADREDTKAQKGKSEQDDIATQA